MTNKEKYGNEIIDIAIRGGSFAVLNGKPLSEGGVNCIKCAFFKDKDCVKAREAWLNSEYVEQPVDWSKVAVDTPILVRNSEEEKWKNRHFAKYECGIVYAWGAGATSWSACSNSITDWNMAKLAESES